MSLSIIIATAGKATRFYSEALEIPKCLTLFNQKPIISHLIDLYKKISNNIIIVISKNDLGNLLKNWLIDYYKNPQWLKFVEQDSPIGTNDAIKKSLHLIDDKFIVSWSDFILYEDLFEYINSNEDIFFTGEINCRFGLENNKIQQVKSNPGFIGVYLFNKKPQLNDCEDFIENFIGKEIKTQKLKITTIGTITEAIKNNVYSTKSNRYFNEIIFEEDKIIKIAKTQQAIELQKKEINWYKNCNVELQNYIPKFEVINNNLVLERIKGRTLSECKFDKDFWREKLPKLLKALHKEKSTTDINSCISTYITKPFERLFEVNNTINAWFDKSRIINNIDFNNWSFPSIPKDLIPKNFTFIHGDFQFSNSIMDENNKIKIFDPRGYFGTTELYGDPAYDLAKILYAIDAYHKINENKFSINKMKNGNTFLIHNYDILFDDNVKYFFNWACDYYEISKEKLNFLLFGIWLSLTGYIKNNTLGIIASYSKALIRSKDFLIK